MDGLPSVERMDIAVNKGSGLGFDLWLTSISLFIVSSLLGGLNYISTVINLRTRGMTLSRLPLVIWALMFAAVLGVLAFPALLSAAVLLEFDRLLDTSFFLNNIVINGELLAYKGGSPILYQHLFWFLGHPEVYIIIIPAMGIVSDVMSVHARKPIFGYKAMLISMLAIVVIGFFVWAHHMFVTGMSPVLGVVFAIFTLLIAVPSALRPLTGLPPCGAVTCDLQTDAFLYRICFSVYYGGVTGIFLGNPAVDVQLHDTYFVVAHFHIIMGVRHSLGCGLASTIGSLKCSGVT